MHFLGDAYAEIYGGKCLAFIRIGTGYKEAVAMNFIEAV